MKNKLEEIFKSKTKTISLIVAILVSVSILLNVYLEYNETGQVDTNKISEAISTVVDEINKSSTEIPNLTETDEQSLEVQETESEGFEEQGIIAYEGSEKTPNVQVGEYAGLTYYSQLDSRRSNKMYSSIENKSQTIGSSGCGPTSAAMVVSSIKGNITPDTMAELYTKYSYRSANQGTYWSAFKWTADIFDIGYSECYKLDEAVTKLKDNNYKIYLLSNINPYTFEFVNKSGLFDFVDGYVLSYQEHKIKPYKAIYNVLLERYNLIPNESVFIDDNKNNIETGNSMGIISKKVEPDDYYSIIKIIKEFNLIQGEI